MFLVSTGGCGPWSFLVTKTKVIMLFDREGGAEAGMSSLFLTFPISMLMLYTLLSPLPNRKEWSHLLLVYYFWDQNLLRFCLFCRIILVLSVTLSVPVVQDCFVFTRHLHCLFLQTLLLAHIFLNSFCPLVTLCLWLLMVLRCYEYYKILIHCHQLCHYYVLMSGFTTVKYGTVPYPCRELTS